MLCLHREIRPCPRRKAGGLPAGYFVGELNSAVQIRAQVRMSLEVTQHLRDLGGPREESRENFLWDLFERELVALSMLDNMSISFLFDCLPCILRHFLAEPHDSRQMMPPMNRMA